MCHQLTLVIGPASSSASLLSAAHVTCYSKKRTAQKIGLEPLVFFFRPVLGARLCRGGEGRLGSVVVLKHHPQETVLQGRGLACGPVLPDVVIAVLLHLYKKERTFA